MSQLTYSNPLASSSYWLLTAKSIIIENIAGVFIAEIQSKPIFMNGNGKSALFNIYVRDQATGELVDTIQGSFQLSLTPTGTFNTKGDPYFLLNFATSFIGSAQTTIVCPGGKFAGINKDSDTQYGVALAYIGSGLTVPGSKAAPGSTTTVTSNSMQLGKGYPCDGVSC